MSRFIQVKQPTKKADKERTLPKPGKYSSKDLKNTKPIYSNTGGKY